jgi:2-polyprenyl-3-methyl-5-hydroxy-6-metoxy-1,4-benzoquinol methylase
VTDAFEIGGIAAAVVAADKSGLLKALVQGSDTPAGFASELGLDLVGAERVIEVLAAAGVLECNNGAYTASAEVKRMDGMFPGGVSGLVALWSNVPALLERGERWARMDGPLEQREESYSGVVSGLGAMFAGTAKELAAKLAAPAKQILDVGAGSGVWSLSIGQRHPEARVTALDLPNVLPNFLRRAEQMGLADRADTLPGDYHSVEVPAGRYDLIILANILHLEPVARAAAVVRRFAGLLPPGGAALIIDVIGKATQAGQLARAVYALHLTLRTEQGRAHLRSDYSRWLEEAGLSSPQVIELEGPPGALGALLAYKTGSP